MSFLVFQLRMAYIWHDGKGPLPLTFGPIAETVTEVFTEAVLTPRCLLRSACLSSREFLLCSAACDVPAC